MFTRIAPSVCHPCRFHGDGETIIASLYGTASILISTGTVTVEQLWSHLTPKDEEIELEMGDRFKQAVAYRVPRTDEDVIAAKIKFDTDLSDSGSRNQKLGLLLASLFKEDIATASKIIALFPRFVGCGPPGFPHTSATLHV
jgi:hypothetical protein